MAIGSCYIALLVTSFSPVKFVSIRFLFHGALLAAGATLSRAQLVLHVDAAAKTLSFTGSTTGNSTTNTISWYDPGTITNGVKNLSSSSTYITVTGTSYTTVGFIAYSTGEGLRFRIAGTQTVSGVTIAGTGVEYDYSTAFDANTQSILESHIGQTLSLENGSGFSDLSIVASSVPEPSTYALILGGMALAGVIAVRRRAGPRHRA